MIYFPISQKSKVRNFRCSKLAIFTSEANKKRAQEKSDYQLALKLAEEWSKKGQFFILLSYRNPFVTVMLNTA